VIPLLLLAAHARGGDLPQEAPRVEDGAVYARLFGDEGTPEAAAAPSATSASPWRLAGPALLLLTGAGATWMMKRRVESAGGLPITVLSRQALGDRSSLVLVEVVDADGEKRRLLLGTGGGPPSLVADLGVSVPEPLAPNIATQVLAERRAATPPDFAREAARRGLP